jgi:hypothetical protein
MSVPCLGALLGKEPKVFTTATASLGNKVEHNERWDKVTLFL